MQRRRVASRGNGIAEKKAHFAGDTSGGTEIKVQPGLTRDSYATDDAARASSRVVFTACGYVCMYVCIRPPFPKLRVGPPRLCFGGYNFAMALLIGLSKSREA